MFEMESNQPHYTGAVVLYNCFPVDFTPQDTNVPEESIRGGRMGGS